MPKPDNADAADDDGPIVIHPESASGDAEKNELFSDPEHRRRHLENQSFQQDMTERKRYAGWTFLITAAWVAFMMLTTAAQMYLSVCGYGLSQPSYIALITSSTATVLGMWGIVGAYLFWRPRG